MTTNIYRKRVVRYIASCTLFIPIILFFLSTCALSSAQRSSADGGVVVVYLHHQATDTSILDNNIDRCGVNFVIGTFSSLAVVQ